MAVTPTQFAKKTAQLRAADPRTIQLPTGLMHSDECFRHTENGFELYVRDTEATIRRRRLPRAHLRRRLVNRQRDDPGADIDANQAPEIQTMYSVPFPVSVIRTRMRQEFERHRYVNKLPVVDVLIMQNNAEYQVSGSTPIGGFVEA
ncbi:hypothetical protein LQW54_003316 [Pestalotiopsis sp. IQ-011]